MMIQIAPITHCAPVGPACFTDTSCVEERVSAATNDQEKFISHNWFKMLRMLTPWLTGMFLLLALYANRFTKFDHLDYIYSVIGKNAEYASEIKYIRMEKRTNALL